jgi:Fic family protein
MPVACTPLSSRLKAAASPERRAALREIVRSMNLSYSNRIEGQGTHSANIERALPPVWKSAPRFLGRMDDVYGRLKGVDAVVYTIAAAHHRMAWTHPFEDGNGRAVRLQTHCGLLALRRLARRLCADDRP